MGNQPTIKTMTCIYCARQVDTDEPGFGYLFDDQKMRYYHCECIEFAEGIPLA